MLEICKPPSITDSQILKEKTLENSYQAFLKQSPKSHYFQAAYEILSWLQDDVLSATERINAIFILLEFNKLSENVFLPAVADIVDSSPFSWEKLLLREWLKNKEIGKTSAQEIAKLAGDTKDLDLIISKRSKSVRPVVNAGSTDKINLNLGKFDPEFLRPIPDIIGISSCETNWISPMTVPEVLWNNENQNQRVFAEEAKDLLRTAISQKLAQDQTNTVINALKNDSKFVFKCGISHKSLGDIIERNSAIAVEIILSIMNTSKVQDYFGELVNLPLSLSSLEVVNKLALMMELPPEFLHLFISNCMNSCKMVKEKYNQTRYVRLLCVFINSLLKNKVLDNGELYGEILGFCSDFSGIKEANLVHSLIKKLSGEKE